MKEFAASTESEQFAEAFGAEVSWSALWMHLGGNYFGKTPATITPGEMHEILFEIFPRKVSADSSEAQVIVAELRAFWEFL